MSTPLNATLTGTFVSTGAAFLLNLPTGYDRIDLINMTDIGSAAAATPVMKATGTSDMAAGSALVSLKTNGAATIALETGIVADGFTFISDTGGLAIGPTTVLTASTNVIGPVVSTATPAAVGQVVRLYSTTTALQLAGMDYQVTAVTPGVDMTLGNVGTAPGSASTAGSFRIINANSRFYPRTRYISAITAAASAVITTTVDHGYAAGQKVRIYIPRFWGMTQLNNQVATITAVTASTFTINVDTSTYTAFAYPTSAQAGAGVSFPIVVPFGEDIVDPYQNLLSDGVHNISETGVVIGTAVQTTAKTYQWLARKGVTV
jgi:hypothetical protein